MQNKLYTKEEVEKLLEQQRELCLRKAKIRTHEYVNPYSESDGEKWQSVDKKSILEAKLNF